jgi:hypothetical protein
VSLHSSFPSYDFGLQQQPLMAPASGMQLPAAGLVSSHCSRLPADGGVTYSPTLGLIKVLYESGLFLHRLDTKDIVIRL